MKKKIIRKIQIDNSEDIATVINNIFLEKEIWKWRAERLYSVGSSTKCKHNKDGMPPFKGCQCTVCYKAKILDSLMFHVPPWLKGITVMVGKKTGSTKIEGCGEVVRLTHKDSGEVYYIVHSHTDTLTKDLEKACLFNSTMGAKTISWDVDKAINYGKIWTDADDNTVRKKLEKDTWKIDCPKVERVTTVSKRLKI